MSNAITEAGTTLVNYDYPATINDAVFSPDESKIAIGGRDASVHVIDAETGDKLFEYDKHKNSSDSVDFSPDGSKIVSGGGYDDETIYIFDSDTGDTLLEYDDIARVYSVEFSPDGSKVAAGEVTGGNSVYIIDADTGEKLLEYGEHSDYVYSVAFSPDGNRAASGSADETVHVFDTETGDKLLEYDEHSDEINDVAFSPDGNKVASASDYHDQTVHIFDADIGEKLLEYDEHSSPFNSVEFSPDGSKVAAGSDDGPVHIFDTEIGDKIFEYTGLSDAVNSVNFSPDGSKAISSGGDEIMKCYNLVDWYLNIIDKRVDTSAGFEGTLLGDSIHGEFTLDLGDIKLEDESDVIPCGFINLTKGTIKNVNISSADINSGITFTKSKEEDSFEDKDELDFAGPYEHEEGDDFYVQLDTDNTAATGDGTLDLIITADN